MNQLFVLGLDIKKGKLVLAKVNGKNRPSLYFYDLPIQEPDYVNLLRPEESILHRLLDGGIDAYPDPYGSGKVLLFSPAAVVKINWNPEVGKQKIHLLSPSLFTDFEAGFCFGFIKDQMIFHALHDGSTTFYHHNFDLTKSVDWLLPFEHLLDEYAFNTMFVRNGRIYQTTSQSFQVKKEEENEFKIIAPLAGGYDPGIMWPSPYNLHSDWAIWGKEGFQIVRFNEKGHSLSEPFSPPSKENFKPLKMAIVPADKLVIASISRIKVYDIIPETPVLMHEYQAEDTILDIQSSGERNTVLVILKKGKVLKYRLD